MPVPTIQLSGSALTGIQSADKHARMLVSSLPATVKLGRIRPKCLPYVPKLSAYINAEATQLPPSINRRDKAAASIARMYMNADLGCCVISSVAHRFGVHSANDSDSPGVLLATDQEISSQYFGWCGPGDNGCNITSVLDLVRARGFKMGGVTYKIDGYVAVDPRNKLMTSAGLYVLGAGAVGINLPQAWTENDVWDVTNTPIVGGHDVCSVDYSDNDGVYISSWGRTYLITWAAWLDGRWIEEHYCVLAPQWYGNDAVNSATGLNVQVLKDDMVKFQGGIFPDIGDGPDPVHPCPAGQHWDEASQACVDDPPPPPLPPTPNSVTFSLRFPKGGLEMLNLRTWIAMAVSQDGDFTLSDGTKGHLQCDIGDATAHAKLIGDSYVDPFNVDFKITLASSPQPVPPTPDTEPATLIIPPLILKGLHLACDLAASLTIPQPWKMLIETLCSLLPPETAMMVANSQGMAITLPPWVLPMLRVACRFAPWFVHDPQIKAIVDALCALIPVANAQRMSGKGSCGCR